MERRKFLQLIVVGVVALAAKITGGLGAGPEQPESQGGYAVPDKYKEKLIGAIKGRKIYSTPVTYDNVETMLEKTHSYIGKPCLIQFTQTPEDPDSWIDLEGPIEWEDPLPPGFVILEPSEQVIEELEGLKVQSISILARYADD